MDNNSTDGAQTPPPMNGSIKTEIKMETGDNSPPLQPTPPRKSNKRKSAKPQWSYEGTQLDKSRQSGASDNNNFPMQVDAELQNDAVDSTEEALNLKNNNKLEKPDQHKIQQLKKSIQTTGDSGKDLVKGDGERNESIKKIQEKISQKGGSEEWEF